MKKWRCVVCGFEQMSEEVPETCPGCGAPKYKFSMVPEGKILLEKSQIGKMEWKCSNCGYALSGSVPPEICPGCNEKCQFIDVTCYIPECTGRNLEI